MSRIRIKSNKQGDSFWYKNGKLHRTDVPAVEFANGDKHWYRDGKHHRTDGHKEWYQNGRYV